MTVAVLNPQDCLVKDYRLSKQPLISPLLKDSRNPNSSNHRSNRAQQQPNRTKRSPPKSHKNNNQPLSRAATAIQKSPAKNNLVMGKVKILKRGEELSVLAPKPDPAEPEKKKVPSDSALAKKRRDPDLCSTERLGPEPESVQVQIRLSEAKNRAAANFYAGSAFITSPPPSSLPLPAFFTKKSDVTVINDDATDNLIKMLNLKLDRKKC